MGLGSLALDHQRVAYVLTLGVVPGPWRGRGVAARLIELAMARAAEARCALHSHAAGASDFAAATYIQRLHTYNNKRSTLTITRRALFTTNKTMHGKHPAAAPRSCT